MKNFTKLSMRDIVHGIKSLDFVSALESLALRSGGIGRIANGFWVVSDPALLDEVLVKKVAFFDKNNTSATYQLLTQKRFPGDTGGVLDGGPFTQDDLETWRLQRDVCNPYFQTNKLGSVGEQTVLFLEDLMLDWKHEDDVDILDAFKKTALHTLSHHLFGGKISQENIHRISSVAPAYFEKMAWQLILGMLPTRNMTGWKTYEALGQEFTNVIETIIDDALEQPSRFKSTLIGDLLKAFGSESTVKLSSENRRIAIGTIGTMYLAGFDSTAVVATHACLALSKDQPLQAYLREELRAAFGRGPLTPEKLPELPALQAFWQLMLHEHTAFRIIFRNVAQTCTLNGELLQAGDQLLLALHAAHIAPNSHMTIDDFLAGKPSSHVRNNHLPYGKGQRKCIGAPMADIQGPLMIATVLWQQMLSSSWPSGSRRRMGMTSAPVHTMVRTTRR